MQNLFEFIVKNKLTSKYTDNDLFNLEKIEKFYETPIYYKNVKIEIWDYKNISKNNYKNNIVNDIKYNLFQELYTFLNDMDLSVITKFNKMMLNCVRTNDIYFCLYKNISDIRLDYICFLRYNIDTNRFTYESRGFGKEIIEYKEIYKAIRRI